MSQNQVNARRNWKAETFPYEYYLIDPGIECNYCLTEKQAEILRGIVEPLAWTTRWWSDTGSAINQDNIQEFRDDIIRRLMMSCCGDEIPVQYRYSSTGVLQRSVDGGVTWEDASEYDPRNNSPQFPPMSGPDNLDKRCIAATGAAALIKEQVGDQLTDSMSRYTLSQLITDWTQTYINTSNPFEALLTVISNQIFALVIAVLRPALTDGVYDTLRCIFYCRMANNATFDTTQWESVRLDITDQITGVAGIFLEHLVYLLGIGGLTNLARAGGATSGDCSDCSECAELRVYFTNGSIPGVEIFPDGLGVYSVVCDNFSSGGYYGNISFFDPTITPDYNKCSQVIPVSSTGSYSLSVRQDCHTGANNYLSTCYALDQYYSSAPWSLTFTVATPCG